MHHICTTPWKIPFQVAFIVPTQCSPLSMPLEWGCMPLTNLCWPCPWSNSVTLGRLWSIYKGAPTCLLLLVGNYWELKEAKDPIKNPGKGWGRQISLMPLSWGKPEEPWDGLTNDPPLSFPPLSSADRRGIRSLTCCSHRVYIIQTGLSKPCRHKSERTDSDRQSIVSAVVRLLLKTISFFSERAEILKKEEQSQVQQQQQHKQMCLLSFVLTKNACGVSHLQFAKHLFPGPCLLKCHMKETLGGSSMIRLRSAGWGNEQSGPCAWTCTLQRKNACDLGTCRTIYSSLGLKRELLRSTSVSDLCSHLSKHMYCTSTCCCCCRLLFLLHC